MHPSQSGKEGRRLIYNTLTTSIGHAVAFLWEKKNGDLLLQEGPYFIERPLGVSKY